MPYIVVWKYKGKHHLAGGSGIYATKEEAEHVKRWAMKQPIYFATLKKYPGIRMDTIKFRGY